MTSSSSERNVQKQSSNPQPILRTKHSYQYLNQLMERRTLAANDVASTLWLGWLLLLGMALSTL